MNRLPLAGIRITDFSWAIAAPYATLLLSYLGAEVIKIETSLRLDITRTVVHPLTKKRVHPDESPAYVEYNHNKLAITLNLRHPAARDIAKEMVKMSDVVVENFRPGVLERMGLDYPALSRLRPDLVMLSTTTVGQTGPDAQVVGYAPNFAATAGLGELTGYPDSSPAQLRLTVDALSGFFNAFAILAALNYRDATGQGQYIDASCTEAVDVLLGDSLLDLTANGRVQRRSANRDEHMAPHNCYRCQGQDRWISIAVSTEEEWHALHRAMGDPEWARDQRFADAASRWRHQEELDNRIGEWTQQFDCYELMHRLQAAGVAAVPSFSSQDLFTDPHLIERGLVHVVEQPRIGAQIVLSPPWRLSATPARIERHAPQMGEHNDYVFRDLLGLSAQELRRLEQEGALS